MEWDGLLIVALGVALILSGRVYGDRESEAQEDAAPERPEDGAGRARWISKLTDRPVWGRGARLTNLALGLAVVLIGLLRLAGL